jgi:DNA repair protein RecO (recombination protein O)
MSTESLSTSAILLRRTAYGDFDLILTFITLEEGLLTAMGKSARKSVKRFGGALELFSIVDIVATSGPKQRLPMLQEAVLTHPLSMLRSDILKTAYAGYFSEIILSWMMEGKKEDRIFHLLRSALSALNDGAIPDPLLSLSFQMKFLFLAGLRPNLCHCMRCGGETDAIRTPHFTFDPRHGSLFCGPCSGDSRGNSSLSKGTIKLLSFLEQEEIEQVKRIRISSQSLEEGQNYLETLIPHHLGKKPNSLTFLQKLRPGRKE